MDSLWPLDKAGEVAGRADITTDAEHAGLLLDHVVWEFNLGRSLLCHLFHLWQDWISNRSSQSTRQARHLLIGLAFARGHHNWTHSVA